MRIAVAVAFAASAALAPGAARAVASPEMVTVPVRGSGTANATALPGRTPGTDSTTRSRSSA